MIHDTQSAQISQKQDERNIYVIMKTMFPPGYHHNGFVATHALGHMMYGSCAQVYEYIYIYIRYTHVITSTKIRCKQTWRLTKAIAEMKRDTEQTMKDGVAVQSWV